jgi:chloramphenicol-sensitive protein RarD
MSVEQPQSVRVSSADKSANAGFFYALTAYLLWGVLPLYMKAIEHIPAVEVVAHRILWSIPVAAVILVALGRTSDFVRALGNPKILGMMFVTAVLISINWGIYIWSISANIASQAALGYYINPLMSILLGMFLLGEKLDRLQIFAVLLAFFAVTMMTVAMGALPWVAIVLAISFTIYGYLRKTVDIGPTQGFLLEVILMAPFAAGYLIWLSINGANSFSGEGWNNWLLAGTGLATAIPLILYASGAKRLRLSTIGLMQYIAPTMIFLFAIFVFNEPISMWQLIAFVLIWTALALYSVSIFRQRKH